MKRLLNLLLLLLVAPAGAVLESCTAEDGDCRINFPESFFDVQGLALDATRTTGQALTAGEAVSAAEVQLAVQLQVRYYSGQSVRGGWLPAAYACPPTPIPGYMGTTEVLDSLVVRSVYAYDAAHPAGTSLNDLLVSDNTGQPLPPVPPRGTQPMLYTSSLRLRQGPSQAGPQQFVLRYRLTNGETYTARTPVLTLR